MSWLVGEGMRHIAKLCGYNAFMPGNNLLVPFSKAADIGKAFSNAWKVFDGKERPWDDDALSFHELLRTAAAGTVAFSPRTTKGGAAAVGAALTMAALLNVTEFALKTVPVSYTHLVRPRKRDGGGSDGGNDGTGRHLLAGGAEHDLGRVRHDAPGCAEVHQ